MRFILPAMYASDSHGSGVAWLTLTGFAPPGSVVNFRGSGGASFRVGLDGLGIKAALGDVDRMGGEGRAIADCGGLRVSKISYSSACMGASVVLPRVSSVSYQGSVFGTA